MKRREFITVLGGAAAVSAWPLVARAQQPAMPVIGYLNVNAPDMSSPSLAAFHQGLSEVGYFESKNVAIEYRWGWDHVDQLPALAMELVERRVAAIVTPGSINAVAAKAATSTIPIVFYSGGDPVSLGLVASLNRPGGNITGVTRLSHTLAAKHVELLHEFVPDSSVIGMLINPNNPSTEFDMRAVQDAARSIRLQVHVVNASREQDFENAFEQLAELRVRALLIYGDPFFTARLQQIAALALRNAMPTIHGAREYAVAGGFLAYGASFAEMFRQVGIHTGRILKGAKPADLPVQQPTKFELVVNNKTAKALGLTIPESLLLRADEVIE